MNMIDEFNEKLITIMIYETFSQNFDINLRRDHQKNFL